MTHLTLVGFLLYALLASTTKSHKGEEMEELEGVGRGGGRLVFRVK